MQHAKVARNAENTRTMEDLPKKMKPSFFDRSK